MESMKIVTKRDGKFVWIALKDKMGRYHCWFDENSHVGKNMVSGGHLYFKSEIEGIKSILKKEGHY